MYHKQDISESVYIESIEGDIKDLYNSPIIVAKERVKTGNDCDCESRTWTFYTFRNVNATVTIRWNGCSNGYYSERVNFEKISQ